jgi:branched-chain amino acid transport system permease protein
MAFGLCLWIMLQAGMLSLGQGAFIAIGAYATGIFSVKYSLVSNLWLCYLIGASCAALLAFLLGLITVHLRRIFFLLVTWAFGRCFIRSSPPSRTLRRGLGHYEHPPSSRMKIFSDPWTGYYFIALGFAFSHFS